MTATQSVRTEPACDHNEGPQAPRSIMVRDYRAEAVGIGAGVRVSRAGTMKDQRELFLPTNRDFAGNGDPDGTKGMREWRENNAPADGNSKPSWPGQVDKKVW